VKTVSFTAGFELEFDVLIKNIYPTIFLLCKNTLSQSKLMIDVICYDYLKGERRFMLIYNLLSVRFNTRFRVRSRVSNTDNLVSLISLYKSVG
jgi:NADH:ubiquinone oxidoreductase subunit C